MLGRLLPQNVHTLDRGLRVLLGAAVMSLAVVGPQTPWGWLGAIFVITGFVGHCPLYRLFGVSTCQVPLRKA